MGEKAETLLLYTRQVIVTVICRMKVKRQIRRVQNIVEYGEYVEDANQSFNAFIVIVIFIHLLILRGVLQSNGKSSVSTH
jgi:hypothetical protein